MRNLQTVRRIIWRPVVAGHPGSGRTGGPRRWKSRLAWPAKTRPLKRTRGGSPRRRPCHRALLDRAPGVAPAPHRPSSARRQAERWPANRPAPSGARPALHVTVRPHSCAILLSPSAESVGVVIDGSFGADSGLLAHAPRGAGGRVGDLRPHHLRAPPRSGRAGATP